MILSTRALFGGCRMGSPSVYRVQVNWLVRFCFSISERRSLNHLLPP